MWPAYLPIDSLSNTSWRASATRIASACVSHSFVLPSMSVNRNVTVPTGSGAGGAGPGRFLVNQRARRGTANDPIGAPRTSWHGDVSKARGIIRLDTHEYSNNRAPRDNGPRSECGYGGF